MGPQAKAQTLGANSETGDQDFVKGLGLTSATTLVMGSMIGSGVFIVAADIARLTDSPALLIGAWLMTAFMTIVAALSYGELAAMMPRAGGQYVYLREALGPLWGWLYGWTLFLVIQTGTIAAVGVAFGKFLGVFFPSVSSANWIWHIAHVPPVHLGPMVLGNTEIGLNTANLVGILIIVLLSIVNIFGVRTGAAVQNVFTTAKVFALLGLVALGLIMGRNANALQANFNGNFWHIGPEHMWTRAHGLLMIFVLVAAAQVGSLFSSDAWNNVTFTAGEVKNPSRNLPLSLALGTGMVSLLYIAANFVYLLVLPMGGYAGGATVLARGIQFATEDRVGTAVLSVMFGQAGASIMAAAILISTFGCANGLILAGARVYYAMAKDGLFFRSVGRLHPRYKTPVAGLGVQAAWTCVLCLSGTYSQLLDYIIFAALFFYILTISGVFILRRTRPQAPRPYRAVGYPALPAIYILLAAFVDVVLLRYKPQYTWPGLAIVLLGIPVYFIWHKKKVLNTQ